MSDLDDLADARASTARSARRWSTATARLRSTSPSWRITSPRHRPWGVPTGRSTTRPRPAHEAMRRFGYEQATELFQLALEMDELLEPDPARRAGLLLALGLAQARTDHAARHRDAPRRGGGGTAVPDPRLFAEAALAIRAYPQGIGVICEQPSALLERGARAARGGGRRPARARARPPRGSLYYWPGTAERRAELAEEAVTTAREARRSADPDPRLEQRPAGGLGPGHDASGTWAGWKRPSRSWTRPATTSSSCRSRNRQIDFLIELDDLPAAAAALRALELTITAGSDPRAPAYVQLHQRSAGHHRRPLRRRRPDERRGQGGRGAAARPHARGARPVAAVRPAVGTGAARGDRGAVRQITEGDVTSAWQAALTMMCAELGYEEETRRRFERIAAHDYADIPRYNGWLQHDGCVRRDLRAARRPASRPAAVRAARCRSRAATRSLRRRRSRGR